MSTLTEQYYMLKDLSEDPRGEFREMIGFDFPKNALGLSLHSTHLGKFTEELDGDFIIVKLEGCEDFPAGTLRCKKWIDGGEAETEFQRRNCNVGPCPQCGHFDEANLGLAHEAVYSSTVSNREVAPGVCFYDLGVFTPEA